MKQYTAISLFSGGFGLDLGLIRTGRFDILASVEKEKSFCNTIRANQRAGRLHPHHRIYEGDIADFDPIKILNDCGLKPGELDLVVGGPPCQSFSTAGRRGTVQDPRGTLMWEYLRFIEAMKPRFFIMENVRGLLSAALRHRPIAKRKGEPLEPDEMPGSVVRLFAEDLQGIEGGPYHMDCFEVNAVNYGAPQLRERAIFIGNRFDTAVDFPNPTHGPQSTDDFGTLFEGASHLQPWRTLGDAIGQLNDPGDVIMDFSPRKKGYLSQVPPGSNWRSLPVPLQQESMGHAWFAKGGRSGWWRRLSFDLPCPTLVTMPNHASTSLCHPLEVRALSLREYAAIQEFPSDWEFCGTASQQYAQVGNAVPVRLGQIAGQVVARAMDDLADRGWKPRHPAPEHYRVIYIQSHVRTRQWFKKGKTFVWSDGKDNDHASYEPPQTLRRVRAIKENAVAASSKSNPLFDALKARRHKYDAAEIVKLFSQVDETRVDHLARALTTYIGTNLPQAFEKRNGLSDYRTNPYVLMTSASVMKLGDPAKFSDFLFNSKLYMALETSFGKQIEAAFVGQYPIEASHRWTDAPEKTAEFAQLVGLSREAKAQQRVDSVWREIDRSCVVGNKRFLTSIKSGPNTINDTQVAGMTTAILANYKAWMSQTAKTYPGVTELDVVLGLTYGTDKTTNNKENQILVKLLEKGFVEEDRAKKPGVLIDESTRKVRVYRCIGREFWAFIGQPDAPATTQYVFLEVLLALSKSLGKGMEEADLEARINAKLQHLSRALVNLQFPRKSLPAWVRDEFTEDQLFWFATAMTAFYDEGI